MQLTQPPLPRGLGERVAQGVSAVLVLGPLAYTSWMWNKLPARIPLHFGFNGQADGFGDARNFWLVPTFGLVLFVGLTLLERVPHVYNYPYRITDNNREATYRLGRRMVLGLKTSLTAVLAYVTIATLQTAVGHTNGLGAWFVPTVMAAMTTGLTICLIGFTRIYRTG